MSAGVEPVESPCVCATLRMATRAVARVYDRALEPHGLRTTQYSILARLEVEGPAPVGFLAARIAMDRTTLAREAAPLVRAGLVDEEPGQDRRQRVLALAPRAGAARGGPPCLARRAAAGAGRAGLRPRAGPTRRAQGPARRNARRAVVSFPAMHASLTTVRGAGPEVSATARMAAESMLTWLREFDGYRGLLILGDPESGKSRIVSFWDSLEALERSDKSRREVRDSMIAVAGAELESVVRYELFLGKNFPTGRADAASEQGTPAAARFTCFEGPPESIEEGLRIFREDLVDWFRDATGFRGWLALLDVPNGR